MSVLGVEYPKPEGAALVRLDQPVRIGLCQRLASECTMAGVVPEAKYEAERDADGVENKEERADHPVDTDRFAIEREGNVSG